MSEIEASFRRFSQIDIFCIIACYIYEYFFFQVFDSLYWLNENVAMIEHTIELQFRMNDVKNKNNNKKQHSHSDENRHKKKKKQQNDYEEWGKFKMFPF